MVKNGEVTYITLRNWKRNQGIGSLETFESEGTFKCYVITFLTSKICGHIEKLVKSRF